MDIDTNIIKEQVRELNRSLNRECEQLQEQMEKINNHLDDEQPESAPMTNVTVQAGGINVQQANTVVR